MATWAVSWYLAKQKYEDVEDVVVLLFGIAGIVDLIVTPIVAIVITQKG